MIKIYKYWEDVKKKKKAYLEGRREKDKRKEERREGKRKGNERKGVKRRVGEAERNGRRKDGWKEISIPLRWHIFLYKIHQQG